MIKPTTTTLPSTTTTTQSLTIITIIIVALDDVFEMFVVIPVEFREASTSRVKLNQIESEGAS